jgi:hypothetical protein
MKRLTFASLDAPQKDLEVTTSAAARFSFLYFLQIEDSRIDIPSEPFSLSFLSPFVISLFLVPSP